MCPNCGSNNLDVLDERYEENHHQELYECNDCGCIFRWESHRTIEELPDDSQRPVTTKPQNRTLSPEDDEEDD
jgi:uncharacterized Zn finger protein